MSADGAGRGMNFRGWQGAAGRGFAVHGPARQWLQRLTAGKAVTLSAARSGKTDTSKPKQG